MSSVAAPADHRLGRVELAPVLRGGARAVQVPAAPVERPWARDLALLGPPRRDRKLSHDHASGRLEGYDLTDDLGRRLERVGGQPSLDEETVASPRLLP